MTGGEKTDLGRHLEQVRDLPGGERGGYIASLRASDPKLADRIVEALGANPHADLFASAHIGNTTDSVDFAEEVLRGLETRKQGVFERYRLEDELARGGQGKVLRVWDEDLRRNLAMKVILDGDKVRAFDRSLGRFLEEAQVTAQLDHPGIVPVHDLGLDDDGRVYFTMKLVKGKTLHEVLDDTRMGNGDWTQTRILGVMLKVCEAMAYAHSKGVIHRDLKPSNIMVGRYGEVLVMDWGLARVMGREDKRDLRIESLHTTSGLNTSRSGAHEDADSPLVTMDGDVVGTPAYMSPEQATGRLSEMGPASDVYAMGAMLYHLLAGHMPYVPPGRSATNYAVWQWVQTGPPDALTKIAPETPPELVAICERAMEREIPARYADTNELADELRAYLEHRVVRAHRSGPTTRLAKWVERNPLPVGISLAALFLLVVSSVGFSLRLGREASAKEAAMLERDRGSFEPRVEALIERQAALYPIEPAQVASMQGWIATADEELEQRKRYATADQELDLLVDRLRTTRADVVARMNAASSLHAQTVTSAAKDWEAAIASIAASEVYSAPFGMPLEIEPQLGMRPLGRDTQSGLWEFWLPLTGNEPRERDPQTGRLIVGESTGAILVLLPGASPFDMGAGDPSREGKECPTTLHPFFIGKHEVSQGQWEHVMEVNPSKYLAGREHSDDNKIYESFDRRHPVDSPTHREATDFCSRLGLRLPTEAQWEYATRAGSATAYWFGSTLESVGQFENTALDDAWSYVAPVGSLLPNSFGLHDALGNVGEHCRDRHVLGLGPARLEGTAGERTWDATVEARVYRAGSARHTQRGGSFYDTPWAAHERSGARPNVRSEAIGLRIARELSACPVCAAR